MARRDRRRGGAHSASRAGNGSSDTPEEDTGTPDDAPAPPPTGSGSDDPRAAESTTPATPASSAFGILGDRAADGPTGAAPVVDTGVALTRKELRAAARSPSGGDGRTSKRKKRKKAKRTWLDWVLLSGVIVVALALVAVGTSYAYLQFRFDQVTKVTVKHLEAAPVGQPFNVLLIGSDSRAGETASQATHLGTESATAGQRSDVVKIVHIVPATGQISVLSIPRDTMVTVAGDTEETGQYNRINATYNSGPDQLVQTIETNFGISIQHVVQIDFEGFRGAVDAIGGINLDFPYPAKDVYTGLNITQAGCQHLNGGYSLAVARSRHYEYYEDGYWQYDGTSDFGRIQRQNAFLKALINQAETKYNPLTLNAFIGSVVQGVTVDSTFTVAELISLAREFHTFASQSLATATLPTYSAYSSEFSSFGDVLYAQQPQANQVITQFLGEFPDPALTPPPGPYGVVPTTTTYPSAESTPGTQAASNTTTTIETDFDPTPC